MQNTVWPCKRVCIRVHSTRVPRVSAWIATADKVENVVQIKLYCLFVRVCVCAPSLLTWQSACDRDGCGGLPAIKSQWKGGGGQPKRYALLPSLLEYRINVLVHVPLLALSICYLFFTRASFAGWQRASAVAMVHRLCTLLKLQAVFARQVN